MPFIGLSRPPARAIARPLAIGDRAPAAAELGAPERLRLVAFLRHTGCPFAEHTVRELRGWAEENRAVATFAVCHGERDVAERWLQAIGGSGRVRVVHDPDRSLYAAWGLGYAPFSHFANVSALSGVVRLLTRGIRNRSASGTRWQRAGMFLLEGEQIAWLHVPQSAQEFMLPPRRH